MKDQIGSLSNMTWLCTRQREEKEEGPHVLVFLIMGEDEEVSQQKHHLGSACK